MTESEIEQRLRLLENWTERHDEKCNGRQETLLNAVSVVTKMATRNDERLTEYDKRWAKIAGATGAMAFIGSLLARALGI